MIKPYEKNAKKHPDDQVLLIARSISRFGWQQPIKVGKNNIILAGHGRFQAYEKHKDTLPMKQPWVIDEDGKTISGEAETRKLTLEEENAYRLADNQINALSGNDMKIVVDELRLLDPELISLTGYDADLLLEDEEKDDAIPGLGDTARSAPGDLYEIGRHRVLCGDATKVDDLEKLMNGRKADLWLTDPPYNVNYEGKTKDALKIENDEMSDDTFAAFLTDAFNLCVAYLKQGGVFYIWHADSEGYNFRKACKEAGLKIRQCLIWAKSTMVMGRQDYQWKHEPCLYGWKDGAGHLWNSDRKQTTLLAFDKPLRNGSHPTMKPVELFVYQLTNNTKGEDIILDTFLGSGTTVIAVEKTGRTAYGLELDPKYVDVIVQRYVDFTGITDIKKNGIIETWEKSTTEEGDPLNSQQTSSEN